jgi:hypothetical protein
MECIQSFNSWPRTETKPNPSGSFVNSAFTKSLAAQSLEFSNLKMFKSSTNVVRQIEGKKENRTIPMWNNGKIVYSIPSITPEYVAAADADKPKD